jgi:hypothetical protein
MQSKKVSGLGDAFMNQYYIPILLFMHLNTENYRIRIFYVFTHLIIENNSLTFCKESMYHDKTKILLKVIRINFTGIMFHSIFDKILVQDV